MDSHKALVVFQGKSIRRTWFNEEWWFVAVDIIEIGIPFSDPIADGPILQDASRIALERGATPKQFFSLAKTLTKKIRTPLVVMTYYNIIYRWKLARFLKQVKESGLSGVMIVDLPIEEASQFIVLSRPLDLDTILFVTPQTGPQRAKKIVGLSRGFIYYISTTGITGPKDLSFKAISYNVKRLKNITNLAVCVGFGVHNRKQVKILSRISDGFIVGSALAEFIKAHSPDKNFISELNEFIRKLYV